MLEIDFACDKGADEIDVVIDRAMVLGGKWTELYEEVRQMAQRCGDKDKHMKVILAVGELPLATRCGVLRSTCSGQLGSLENVYKASMTSMKAGADFIKTSTGKESINATLPTGIVMCRAIRDFHSATGRKVGFKPAGTSSSMRSYLSHV